MISVKLCIVLFIYFRRNTWRIEVSCIHLCQLFEPTDAIAVLICFATVNTPEKNSSTPEETNDLKAQIDVLRAEKLKLEAELKAREEMMSNLLSFIQASK